MNVETQKNLAKLAKIRDKRRDAEQEAWHNLTEAMKEAYASDDGATLAEIGRVVGVTKARVYQIVTGKRSGAPKAEASVESV